MDWQPRNTGQQEAQTLWSEGLVTQGACDCLFLLGPAGSGKSHCALGLALTDVKENRAREVVVVRPAVECGARLGFLPGSPDEKLDPYFRPIRRLLLKLAYGADQFVTLLPVAYCRGDTFDHCILVIDEAQNLTRAELKMLLTRLGPRSRVIVAGDPEQADITPTQDCYVTDLDLVSDRLFDRPGVCHVELTASDVLRHPLVRLVSRLL